MKALIGFVLVFVLNGCALLSPGIDRLGKVITNQTNDYCSEPYHRRLAVYIFVNGELKPAGHTISIFCKGDEEDSPPEDE